MRRSGRGILNRPFCVLDDRSLDILGSVLTHISYNTISKPSRDKNGRYFFGLGFVDERREFTEVGIVIAYHDEDVPRIYTLLERHKTTGTYWDKLNGEQKKKIERAKRLPVENRVEFMKDGPILDQLSTEDLAHLVRDLMRAGQ